MDGYEVKNLICLLMIPAVVFVIWTRNFRWQRSTQLLCCKSNCFRILFRIIDWAL